MIDNYINIITFIPWLLLFCVSSINYLKDKKTQEFNIKYLKKNFFKIFRLDTLFLIVVFFYFAYFNKEFVLKYLFAVMCMYLFVNSFYEYKPSLNKEFFKNNFINIILLLIFILIPFIIYFTTHKLELTYKIMLLFYFLEYFINILVISISKFISKIFN
ncbi:MAG: hypothetical protein NC483_07125 [Ruminococcus sp.]|nr:hypothetical protein [Ruminococcus sp.]